MLLKARLSQRQNINTIQTSKILTQIQTTKLSLYIQTTVGPWKTPEMHKEHPYYLLASKPVTRTHLLYFLTMDHSLAGSRRDPAEPHTASLTHAEVIPAPAAQPPRPNIILRRGGEPQNWTLTPQRRRRAALHACPAAARVTGAQE